MLAIAGAPAPLRLARSLAAPVDITTPDEAACVYTLLAESVAARLRWEDGRWFTEVS